MSKINAMLRELHQCVDLLPQQVPLQNFVHFNPFAALLADGFDRALDHYADWFHAQRYLPLAEYRRMLREGRIEARWLSAEAKDFSYFGDQLLSILIEIPFIDSPRQAHYLYRRLKTTSACKIDDQLRDIRQSRTVSDPSFQVFRWQHRNGTDAISMAFRPWQKALAHICDHGTTYVRSEAKDFGELLRSSQPSFKEVGSLEDSLQQLEPLCADANSAAILIRECFALQRTWFALLKGHDLGLSWQQAWCGLAGCLLGSMQGEPLFKADLTTRMVDESWPLRYRVLHLYLKDLITIDQTDRVKELTKEKVVRFFHQALERTTHERALTKLRRKHESRTQASWAAALFCLDDRECSSRRYLEMIDPGVKTFGVAGFFGIPLEVASEHGIEKSCPPAVSPRLGVVRHQRYRPLWKILAQFLLGLRQKAWSRIGSSIFALPTLSLMTFFPWMLPLFRRRLRRLDDVEFYSEGPKAFSVSKAAQMIHELLSAIGLNQEIPSLVACIAHGSSSLNNPYYAAYDCAACSGHSGEINARIFAMIANDPEVRAQLRQAGLHISDAVQFVPFLHNTTTDEYSVLGAFDHPQLPKLIDRLKKVAGKNALERCKRFAKASHITSESGALREVARRGYALFEPRPELGHTGCSLIIVGERSLSLGLDLERRAFLISYSPSGDTNGQRLESLLSAILPVCCGISYDYYASRIDPQHLGSGSKLIHNVTSMMGISAGSEDTLRSGLPWQMVELHEPVRPLLVVQQNVEVLSAILERNINVAHYLRGAWVKTALVTESGLERWEC